MHPVSPASHAPTTTTAEPQDIGPWLGVWCLDPAHAASESQSADAPPELPRAAYTLLADGTELRSHIDWTALDGQRQQQGYALPLDGGWLELAQGAGLARLRWHDPTTPDTLTGAGGAAPQRRAAIGPTGPAHETEPPHVPTAVLITEVCDAEEVVHHITERTLTGDGAQTWMTVVERQRTESGGWTVSRQRYRRTRVKQVICYRRDLKMRKGKIAAQVAHAAMQVFFSRDQGDLSTLQIPISGPMAWWTREGFAKVVLSVDDEDALLRVAALAREAGLPAAVITDAGRTEFKGVPTRTTVAIGPAPVPWIDRITGPGGLVATKLA